MVLQQSFEDTWVFPKKVHNFFTNLDKSSLPHTLTFASSQEEKGKIKNHAHWHTLIHIMTAVNEKKTYLESFAIIQQILHFSVICMIYLHR